MFKLYRDDEHREPICVSDQVLKFVLREDIEAALSFHTSINPISVSHWKEQIVYELSSAKVITYHVSDAASVYVVTLRSRGIITYVYTG
jgi:hypothetical protein